MSGDGWSRFVFVTQRANWLLFTVVRVWSMCHYFFLHSLLISWTNLNKLITWGLATHCFSGQNYVVGKHSHTFVSRLGSSNWLCGHAVVNVYWSLSLLAPQNVIFKPLTPDLQPLTIFMGKRAPARAFCSTAAVVEFVDSCPTTHVPKCWLEEIISSCAFALGITPYLNELHQCHKPVLKQNNTKLDGIRARLNLFPIWESTWDINQSFGRVHYYL